MENLIPVEFDSYPTETHHNTVPVPAEGKKLYISHNSAGIDFQALLGQVVQCVNMGEILAEIKAGTQYVVQIPAEFQKAYESGEMFIMENMKSGKKWPSLMKIAEDGRHQVVSPLPIAEQAMQCTSCLETSSTMQTEMSMRSTSGAECTVIPTRKVTSHTSTMNSR